MLWCTHAQDGLYPGSWGPDRYSVNRGSPPPLRPRPLPCGCGCGSFNDMVRHRAISRPLCQPVCLRSSLSVSQSASQSINTPETCQSIFDPLGQPASKPSSPAIKPAASPLVVSRQGVPAPYPGSCQLPCIVLPLAALPCPAQVPLETSTTLHHLLLLLLLLVLVLRLLLPLSCLSSSSWHIHRSVSWSCCISHLASHNSHLASHILLLVPEPLLDSTCRATALDSFHAVRSPSWHLAPVAALAALGLSPMRIMTT